MTTAIILFGVCALYVLWLILTAPLGYEDATGFHLGEMPDELPRRDCAAGDAANNASPNPSTAHTGPHPIKDHRALAEVWAETAE